MRLLREGLVCLIYKCLSAQLLRDAKIIGTCTRRLKQEMGEMGEMGTKQCKSAGSQLPPGATACLFDRVNCCGLPSRAFSVQSLPANGTRMISQHNQIFPVT